MALANHRLRIFQTAKELETFIRTDAAILTIVSIHQDNSGGYILIFTV